MTPLYAGSTFDQITWTNAGIVFLAWLSGAVIAIAWTRSRMKWQETQYAARAGNLTAKQEAAWEHRLVVEDQLVNGILSWIAVIQLGWSTPHWHEEVFPQ